MVKAEHGELRFQCVGRMLWLSITPMWVSASHAFGREAPNHRASSSRSMIMENTFTPLHNTHAAQGRQKANVDV